MATTQSALAALQDPTRANPSRLPLPNQAGGAVQMAVIHCVLGAGAAADIIELCYLPVGAIPIPGLSFVDAEDCGTTLTLDVGWAENPDGWADGIDIAAAGKVQFTTGTQLPSNLVAEAIPSALIYATVATSGTPTTTADLVFHLAYKLPA